MTATFDDEFVATACRQINDHHADDALAICRTLGGVPDAERAEVTGVDGEALHLAAVVAGATVPLRVPFLEPVTESSQVRVAVVNLARRARGPRNAV